MEELRAEGPLLVVDAGDFAWKSPHISTARLPQQRRKAQLQLEAFGLVGIDGLTPGDGDLVLGANQVVWRGIALPAWVRVAFQGHVVGERRLTFSGTANLRIETWGGWAASWVGVPVRLGTLTYRAERRTEQAGS